MKHYLSLLAVIALFFTVAALSGCGRIKEFAVNLTRDVPTAENTYTSVLELNQDMVAAMERGEAQITFNIAGLEIDELKNIGEAMPTFWGKLNTYSINYEVNNMSGIVEGEKVNVLNVTANFILSNNYYVYNYIKNGAAIPDATPQAHALEIAEALPTIADEIFSETDNSDAYAQALAVHDYLAENISYNEDTDDFSDLNGSYGALITRETMCRGYAEAFALLLKCYTDVEVYEVVGDARQEEADDWTGHAWNIAKIDEKWLHIDATFDDPKDNPSGIALHYYFAQSDTVMAANHKWEQQNYPECKDDGFYYFRKALLYAEDFDDFRDISKRIIKDEGNKGLFQIAAVDITLDKDNIQFIFDIDKEILEVYWSEQVYNNIHVLTIEPKYEGGVSSSNNEDSETLAREDADSDSDEDDEAA